MRFASRSLPVLLLLGSLAACTGTQSASETGTPVTGRAEAVPANSLNMPLLVGRNIDQLRRSLGTPRETKDQKIGLEPTAEQMKSTKGQDWINTFEKDGTTIVATFNARTRKVNDIVVLGSDEDELMRRANLSLTDPAYTVQPVTDPRNPGSTIGVRVVKKN
ncbi:hypothetical protein [Hymenobacter canadensis]|uniref:Lipoprotein n=1 Tax=Hymenobacter canadensis TaxID=2999067 RepID=A0ABY7LTA6_9BACT|nr:hypothetical protein [Hymenobacter canadensis]WBA43637.1 hypothetical protein O3303_08720 [Hymenobacter canadensis]